MKTQTMYESNVVLLIDVYKKIQKVKILKLKELKTGE